MNHRVSVSLLLPLILLVASPVRADWIYVDTGQQSHVPHEDVRLKDFTLVFWQSAFFPSFGDDAKLTTIARRYPIDPRLFGERRARGKLENRYLCPSTQVTGTRILGKDKDRFDPFGNAATTTRVDAEEGCDFFQTETTFLGGQRQPAGIPIDVINGVQRLPDGVSPDCFDLTTLCLGEGRFKVEVDWRDFAGNSAAAVPIAQSDDSGLFYFFDSNNWEMLIKVIDACDRSDRFWVFAGAATDVEYTLTVEDTQANQARTYTNPLGRPAPPIQDTQAFATCP